VYTPLGNDLGIALHDANTHDPAVSQPLAALPSQLEKPALQLPSAHVPPEHTPVALAKLHGLPQRPQWAGLVAKAASQPSTALALQSPKPALQVMPHARLAQVLVALGRAGQAAPHAPQCATLDVTLVSQPFAPLPSQSPKPALQVMPHAPDAQVAAALEGVGHTLPQRPQLARSVERVEHAPLHTV
jgi:hypothetical protein